MPEDRVERFTTIRAPYGFVNHWLIVDMWMGESNITGFTPQMTVHQNALACVAVLNHLDHSWRKRFKREENNMGVNVDVEQMLDQLIEERTKIEATIEYLTKFMQRPRESKTYQAKVIAARGIDSPKPKRKGRVWTPAMKAAASAAAKANWSKRRKGQKAK